MKIEGIIVAGGEATRMKGLEKPLMLLRAHPLVGHVVERVLPQVSALALNVKEETAPLYAECAATAELPLVFDGFHGQAGPLGGVLAALEWAAARGSAWLATFPADTPFLPSDLVARLADDAREDAPAVAVTETKVQGLCALWPVACRERLAEGIATGRYRSLWWTLDDLGAVRCRFDDETAFFNVNTEDDMKEAEAIARPS
ncbi:NTP transferase domain-containing protein [Parvibaculum sp.]|uniref:NTP transferase domain-containing protein n=1 Tax=Parvibaculum sp. TaxID=2024848 RepID=UPI001B01F38A|nr:NTP transferase domain-containing protein [Parvibaculum sp.]MBO6632977.1 NTP transferase domain-containing protein [Parvibaculum sp.]MBO6677757.1 NTP transferase domain-containing protein [Parvibaculum sp.]MBO6684754.1 NTP transferase domain-containing protein [Parvibaculum sp.]MBO6906285.1 NTP transferase domain-containing protein [Parvibaculum sp.]